MLTNFEANRMIQIVINVELFDKKQVFKKHFWQLLMPFCKTFLYLQQLFDGKLLIGRLPFFSVLKIMVVQHV